MGKEYKKPVVITGIIAKRLEAATAAYEQAIKEVIEQLKGK